jgi:hypothetical protein
MHIAWESLVTIAVVATAAALTVVLLVSFALVGLSAFSPDRTEGTGDGSAPATRLAGRAIAGLCLLAAGLIVTYSLYLIVA